jgi:hypothetical protein
MNMRKHTHTLTHTHTHTHTHTYTGAQIMRSLKCFDTVQAWDAAELVQMLHTLPIQICTDMHTDMLSYIHTYICT